MPHFRTLTVQEHALGYNALQHDVVRSYASQALQGCKTVHRSARNCVFNRYVSLGVYRAF